MSHQKHFMSSLIQFLLIQFCASINTITPNQPIKDGDVLVSEGETFALGFFSPGKSSNRYVGIWYNKVSEHTVVWVANRDSPINDTSGVLSMDTTGNLIIHGPDRNLPVWSTNFSAPAASSSYSAQLLDSGNLVVFEGNNKSFVAWQSFDYPTNTLLPYMKLGVNWNTGLNWFPTSWKSADDPGTGEYSYKWDFTGSPPELVLFKGSARWWRAGPWNGLRWSGVATVIPRSILNASFVDNQEEIVLTFTMVDPSIFSRLVVNESGKVQRLTWHEGDRGWVGFWSVPNDQCDYYGRCGVYGNCDPSNVTDFDCKCLPGFNPKSERDWNLRDGSGGCVRKRGLGMCRNGEGFIKVARAKVPDTSIAVLHRNVGLQECEKECLNNCSCTGYASSDITKLEGIGSGCVTWHGELRDTRQFPNSGQDFYIRADAVEFAQYLKSQQAHGKKSMVPVIAASVATVSVVLIISLLCWWVMRKRRGKRGQHKWLFSSNTTPTSFETSSGQQFDERGTNADLPFFDMSTIAAATNNFSDANKLGQGGFGTVYQGRLDNGQEIAVKRLAKNSGQGVEEFKNEVTLIAKLQHRNLVRLLGCCIRQEEKMLIYEYLPNKGLDSFIFDKAKGSLLDWRKRFDIVLGIARGMLYLHQDSRLRIIHRDLKASNVLLDAAMNPKISDFGLARKFGGDQIEGSTNRVVGTYGYMSPEYAMEGQFSIKSDVFSFGVLLLEIISGRKNSSYFQENAVNLIGQVWYLWRKDKSLDIVDSLLVDSYPAQEVLRCIHIGLLCVQEFAMDRPTMSDVAFMLCHETALPPPKQPAFILARKKGPESSSSASVGTSASVNEITLSVIEAR